MDLTDTLPYYPTQRRAGRLAVLAISTVAAALLLTLAASVTAGLAYLMPRQPRLFGISVLFFVTTLVLAAGSFALQRAVRWVRVERQRPFRRWLVVAALLGALFTGLQMYGLVDLGESIRAAIDGTPNTSAFVAAIVFTHACHVVLALLVLTLVTVQAFNDRYDHEYYWGVSFCAGFWHFLGLIWLSVLALSCLAIQ